MNEDLQKQIAESIKSFATAVGDVKDFTVAQAPDVIQQYLYWGIGKSVFTIALSAIVLFLSYKSIFKWTDQRMEYGMVKGGKLAAMLGGGFMSAAACVALITSAYDLVQILLAPKIYLIESAARLLK